MRMWKVYIQAIYIRYELDAVMEVCLRDTLFQPLSSILIRKRFENKMRYHETIWKQFESSNANFALISRQLEKFGSKKSTHLNNSDSDSKIYMSK